MAKKREKSHDQAFDGWIPKGSFAHYGDIKHINAIGI
jgi:hypothetical protein